MTIKELKEELDKSVMGQEDAKRAASVIVASHLCGIKQNALFIGPSGCGKTEIFRTINRICGKVCYIYDSSGTTQDGWSGKKKASSVFSQMSLSGFSKYDIEHSIIVFDEFDKICAPAYSSGGDNVSYSVQSEFLAMIEGTKITVQKEKGDDIYQQKFIIDTSGISFIFLGAFEDLYKKKKKDLGKNVIGFGDIKAKKEDENITVEDLISFGMRSEIAGRIGQIVLLDTLTEKHMVAIMKNPYMSPLAAMADMYGAQIVVNTEKIEKLCTEAVKNKTGVRYLYGQLQKYINQELYEPGSSNFLELKTNNGEPYILNPDVLKYENPITLSR